MILTISASVVRMPVGPAAKAWRTIRPSRPRRLLFGLALSIVATIDGAAAADPPAVRVAQRPDDAAPLRDGRADASAARPMIDAARTGRDADEILQRLLPPRSDTPADWHAPVECLHGPGEPRALTPCVPPPPCDPSQPPHPFDLVGVPGKPTCGPIYRGPCQPRSGRHHHGVFGWYHHLSDRMFDHFYRSK